MQMTQAGNGRMQKRIGRAAAILLCHLAFPPFCHLALADVQSPPAMTPDAANAVLPTARTNLGLGSAALTFGLRQDANNGTASGGASYAAGDTVTLNDGCATHAVLNILQVSSGAPTGFSVHTPGSCAQVPADPVAQLATSGSGSGASFTLRPYWGPLAADVPAPAFLSNGLNGALFYPPSAAAGVLNPNLGPVCVTSSGGCGGNGNAGLGMGGGTGMTGGENSLFGYGAGAQIVGGNFIAASGHNALAVEIDGVREAVFGIDGGKLLQHGTDIAALGTSAAKFLQTPTNIVAIGTSAASGGNPTATVSGAANNGSGLCRLTVNSTAGMATGDKAVVTGIAGTGGIATGCNSVFTNVTVVDGTHIDLTGSAFSGSYTSGGAVSDFTVTQIAAIAAVGSGILNGSAFRGPANHLANIAALGTTALAACTTCSEIAGIGNNFGAAITSGNQHVLAGSNAGNTLSTGAGDVILGYHADATASNVNDAVIIGGNGAGGGAGAKAGSQTVLIGSKSGNGSLTGANQVILGYNAGATNCGTGAGNIVIGQGQDCLSANGANGLNIGGFIEGDLSKKHLVLAGTTPTVGSGSADCGTTPAIAGTDSFGLVTVDSSTNGGKCTVTFANAWTTPPICFAQNQTTGNILKPVSATGTLAITGTLTAGDKLSYSCGGYAL
jgi:hypothetical protein